MMSLEFNIPEGAKINIANLIEFLKWSEEKTITIEELLTSICCDEEILVEPNQD